MNVLLETYIKRCIILEQHANNNIVKAIVNKFPEEYNLTYAPPEVIFAKNKQDTFWKRYITDEAFKNRINSLYAINLQAYFDFLIVSIELREYLKLELQQAELLLIEDNKVSVLKIEDVSSALEIAENVEEFIEMVRATL